MAEKPDTQTETVDRPEATIGAKPVKQQSKRRHPLLTALAAAIAVLAVLVGSFYGYAYASTPLDVRQPLLEHYHFRLQIIVNGKSVSFATAAFQEGYSKDNCNVGLTAHPFHFHDNKDQIVHVHWDGMTGGQLLKYYGWNYIGGRDGSLGYRLDKLPKLVNIPIHGDVLPSVAAGDNFYVYLGNEQGYQTKNFQDFTTLDLEKFLGKTSNLPAHQQNKQKRPGLAITVLDWLNPHANALAIAPASDTTTLMADDAAAANPDTDTTATANDTSVASNDAATADSAPATSLSDPQLTFLNNLLGNVVIFVQKTPPSNQQITNRFHHLEPLSDSVCGG